VAGELHKYPFDCQALAFGCGEHESLVTILSARSYAIEAGTAMV
jgi:hypothetical protein